MPSERRPWHGYLMFCLSLASAVLAFALYESAWTAVADAREALARAQALAGVKSRVDPTTEGRSSAAIPVGAEESVEAEFAGGDGAYKLLTRWRTDLEGRSRSEEYRALSKFGGGVISAVVAVFCLLSSLFSWRRMPLRAQAWSRHLAWQVLTAVVMGVVLVLVITLRPFV